MEYIDMHSHILPGLDDGSKNMEMTLAMLRVAVEEGIGTIYTTPHCMPGKGHPTLAKVEERIRLVQEAAEAEGIQITLKKGTEYYYIEEMSEWMEEGKIITLGDSHCVLVEFEPYAEEKYIRNAVREILGFGYQPVIAHVERYRNLMERKFAAIQWMREIGALIQVNCASVTGDNGFTTKQNVKSLLKNGLVDFVSTDAHRPEGRAPYIEKCAEYNERKNTMQTSYQEDEIEIDLQDLFGLLLHKAWIIILAAIVAGAIGFVVSFFLITPQYESTTSIYISTSKGNENSMTYSDAQLASQLTKDYEELILGRTVLEKVIAQYQLEESYESLKNRVTVANTSNTRIITITVKDPNPANAQIIANSIRDAAAIHIKDVTDVEAVNVADEANLPEKPCEPSIPKWTLIAAMIGIILSASIIIMQYLLDDTIKSSEDIEKYLELSTLGLIPNFDTVEKKKKSRRSKEEEEIHEPRMEADEAIEVVDIEKEQEDAEH